MVRVEWSDPADVARIVEALLLAADVDEVTNPDLARRYRDIADDLGDALDALPRPRLPRQTRANRGLQTGG